MNSDKSDMTTTPTWRPNKSPEQSQFTNSRYRIGIFCAFVSTVVQSSMDAMAKYAASINDPMVVMCVAGGFASVIALTYGTAMSDVPVLKTKVPFLFAIRAVFSLCATIFYLMALTTISLAEAFVAASTMPFVSAILSGIIFRQPVPVRVWVAMVAGVVGVSIMVLDAVPEARVGFLYAFISTVCGGMSILLSRQVYRYENNTFGMVFWPNFMLCVGMAVYLIWSGRGIHVLHLYSILGYAVLLFSGRLLTIFTSRLLMTHVQTAIYNLQFIWVVLLGAIVFGDMLTISVVIGAFILITSTLMLTYYESKRSHDL